MKSQTSKKAPGKRFRSARIRSRDTDSRLVSHPSPSRARLALALTLVLAVALLTSPPTALAGDDLTLRINDAEGAPGTVVAVEVRTYAPRGVGQGQICMSSTTTLDSSGSGSLGTGTGEESGPGAGEESGPGLDARRLADGGGLPTLVQASTDLPDSPFSALEGVVVLSALGDSESSSSFDAGTQTAVVDFLSPSGTINEADGSLAIFYFRLRDDLQPDQEFTLVLDPGVTYLVDDAGNNVPLKLKSGRLRIQEPDPACQ